MENNAYASLNINYNISIFIWLSLQRKESNQKKRKKEGVADVTGWRATATAARSVVYVALPPTIDTI